jgi:hypothetical protein
VTTDTAWTGYSPEELAWFAENYADTEWAVHVIGPDDVHTASNPDLDDDDPANPPFTEATAHAFAANVRQFNAWYHAKYPNENAPGLIPNVFHRGAPVAAKDDHETDPEPGPNLGDHGTCAACGEEIVFVVSAAGHETWHSQAEWQHDTAADDHPAELGGPA